MPIATDAIERFLERRSPAPLEVKDAAEELLFEVLLQKGEVPDYRTLLRKKQLEGLAFSIYNQRCFLFFEMRVGKTLIALDWIEFLRLNNHIRNCVLIISHAPIGTQTWCGEVEQHSSLNVVPVQAGPNAKQDFYQAATNADAIVVSWSALQALFSNDIEKIDKKGKKTKELVPNEDALEEAALLFDAVVIDEIHLAKHHDTLRFAIASKLVQQCQWRLGLTGTPYGRDPFGLWAQFYLIDGGERLSNNYYFFRTAFGKQIYNRFVPGNKEYVFDMKKLPILKEKTQDITLTCLLTDVHEVNVLPGRVELPLSPRQTEAYDGSIKELIEKAKNFKEKEGIFHKLRQISSGYLPYENEYGQTQYIEFLDATKMLWLEDLIDNLDETIKCVIFHEYTHTGERIQTLLKAKRVPHIWLWGGGGKKEWRKEFVQGKARFLIANAATGGTGTDFSVADYLLFFESPPGVVTRKQAEFRPLARGSRPLIMDDLICSTIERRILEFHQEGAEIETLLRKSPIEIADTLRLNKR